MVGKRVVKGLFSGAGPPVSSIRGTLNGDGEGGPALIRTTPPFRADHVGSLLRPPELGGDAEHQHEVYICTINRALSDRPDGVSIGHDVERELTIVQIDGSKERRRQC
jgi:hypothetical protein